MNIFVTDPNPAISARNLDLKRVVKMILESFQLMSNAMWAHGATGFYRPSHTKHPCSLWTAQSRANFQWLFDHALELCQIYKEHYSKNHKCLEHMEACSAYAVSGKFPQESRSQFVNCTEFKSISDVHKAYRFQMLKKWQLDKLAPKWPSAVDPIALVAEWRVEHANQAV